MTRFLRRTTIRKPNSTGQALVEFAFVFPIFMVLLTAVIEYGFLMNANLSASYATRDGSLVAAEAGNASEADCAILKKIEDDVNGPSDPRNITSVQIYWADPVTGVMIGTAADTYTRSATPTLPCTVSGSTFNLNYVNPLPAVLQYPYTARCNILNGCGGGHNGLDTIGVQITYNYTWHTPLKSLLGFTGPGWTVVKSNAMEMEPVL